MSILEVTKYQALSNDYLVLDLPADLDRIVPLLPRLCDRHLGVGSDGLLAFDPSDRSVRIFNPDGSEAEKSGNGLRIAACHAVLRHGAGRRFELRTADRANPVRVVGVAGGRVVSELDIGRPRFEPDRWVFIDTAAGQACCRLVSVGNPHCVVFGEPVTAERCRELGPLLECDPTFPNRTNVQLAEVLDRKRAHIEIWERGAGYTLASGTSASAVAAVLIHMELTESTLEVAMPGGSLSIRQRASGDLVQAGPAERVFTATVDLADLAERVDLNGRAG
ncbi:MAG TPA: diaminopimelate epimerase [Candidatus Dormibacteraeota bacterium]|nr:diaminopimelate epimerase [Candidatus Dormibacteraeota bacterium]